MSKKLKESKWDGDQNSCATAAAASASKESGSGKESTAAGSNFPGAHPSSEGKRRRNRSNVEAMTAKNFQDEREGPSNGESIF